ncbi:MAG: right-handed parallel beta-helix repeat-containing protein [Cellulosilyticaceae bacterium]
MSSTIVVNPTHPEAIQDAIDSASSGTTLLVNDGIYSGFYIGINDITIKAAGKRVIVDGSLPHSYPFDLSTTNGPGVYVALPTPRPLTPSNISITPSFNQVPTLPDDFICPHSIYIEGLTIQNTPKSAILIYYCKETTITDNNISIAAQNGIKVISSDHIYLVSNTIRSCVVAGICAFTSSHLLIRFNHISYCYRGLVVEYGTDYTILYNTVLPVSSCALYLHLINSSIIGNKIYSTHPTLTSVAIIMPSLTKAQEMTNIFSENSVNDNKNISF